MAKVVACKNCGSENLSWRQTPKGWRLFDEAGDQHRCGSVNDKSPLAKKSTENRVSNHSFDQIVEKMADLMLRVDELEKKVESMMPKKSKDQLDLFEGTK